MASLFTRKRTGPTAGTQPKDLGVKIDIGELGKNLMPDYTPSTVIDSGVGDTEALNAFIDEMYEQFRPEELSYDARTADEIGAEVAAWLRPGYDQAIMNRRERTLAYQAEIDADAIARGMGASTYVGDVKARQMRDESRDVMALESDYGSTLVKYVSDGVESDGERARETQLFNIQQRQNAYELAYSAALRLFESYKASGSRRSSGSSGVVATSPENCDLFLAFLTPEERKEVYEAATPQGKRYRDELLASVGFQGYLKLRGKYPESP